MDISTKTFVQSCLSIQLSTFDLIDLHHYSYIMIKLQLIVWNYNNSVSLA